MLLRITTSLSDEEASYALLKHLYGADTAVRVEDHVQPYRDVFIVHVERAGWRICIRIHEQALLYMLVDDDVDVLTPRISSRSLSRPFQTALTCKSNDFLHLANPLSPSFNISNFQFCGSVLAADRCREEVLSSTMTRIRRLGLNRR